ncbi:hypothetical protein PENARI_c009G11067 [Penicillium arizonense]|uniref:Uncharacterized protein n=1 Tax=Penicillium arizonense TaxID=1835702 RepID=A0A1F5LIA7_PENAI|nr:hypothetical protein PENARI_c009G11067 [Penicillium arizonense]OGE52671.1 hypothetical protein PENARI_c009G11067 [Penicillium arizonense]
MPPACAECKVKKCRCTHHAVAAPLVPEAEAKKKIAVASSDDLSLVPSEPEAKNDVGSNKMKPLQKPAHGPRSAATVPPPALHEVPDQPTDDMAAAIHLGIHVVYSRELRRNLAAFQVAFQEGLQAQCASMAEIEDSLQAGRAPTAAALQESQRAHRATMAAAQAIQRKLDMWVESYTSGN